MHRPHASIAAALAGAALFGAALTGCAQEKAAEAPLAEGPVAITVTHEGFLPAAIRVKAGEPVVLRVTRKTAATCATELVLKEYDINQKLPLDETVEIRFTPTKSGKLGYACAMDMVRGEIVVQ